ncbi:MAG: polyprenyl synthetase family protein [Candidatus Adiutrix sp.]|jgi:octaprenyl-diphosphate synthase|nr:polyprenyl synthetase family protein [Candidatus Adiutrix sp.]
MTEIMNILAPLADRINQALTEQIARDAAAVARIGGYIFGGGGKRLRPLIFCLVSEALGRPLTPEAVTTSTAFEFLHMATLLHDDIVDLAEVRRGRVAAHLAFGVQETVLAGDYFLAKAARLGTATGSMDCMKILSGIVGTLALGELDQLGARRRVDLGEAEYFKIIYRKTAVLMEGAARSAALLAGAGDETVAEARRYGRQMGLAFQIMDDILDYLGDPEALGKPAGHDLDEGKITLPFIRAREALGEPRRGRLLGLAERDRLSLEDHRAIAGLVAEGQGVAAARQKAEELAREAALTLAGWPPSPARDQLEALTVYVTARAH